MGPHARTLLAALFAVLTIAWLGAAPAGATVMVRIEAVGHSSARTNGQGPLLARTAVTLTGQPVTSDAVPGVSCSANSAIAALNAAIGPSQWLPQDDGNGGIGVKSIMGIAPNYSQWTAYVDQQRQTDLCHTDVPDGTEVLFFPWCTTTTFTGNCYNGALYMRVANGPLYPMDPQIVPGYNAPVDIHMMVGLGPTLQATVTTDEGGSSTSNDELKQGIAYVRFANQGPHTITATQSGKVPVSAPVCATDGGDGYCGTTQTTPPDTIPYGASPCDTNGHDGNCGTTDTTGPPTTVTNIKPNQVFSYKKSPGQVLGTIGPDNNGVKTTMLRLTRVSTKRIRIKAKHRRHGRHARARYRTVKVCTAWNDQTALFEPAKCGPSGGKWFEAVMDDLAQNFHYGFAMQLPRGTYTLEVQAQDQLGNPDAPAPGRNVFQFKVV